MSRLPRISPRALPTFLQHQFRICRRTFERWCAQGDVPGAYRTRGGHWRVRIPSKKLQHDAILREVWARPRIKTRRYQVRLAIAQWLYPPRAPMPKPPNKHPTQEDFVATRLLWATHGITEDDFNDADLQKRDPEKHRVLFEWSLSLEPPTYPRAYLALKKSHCKPPLIFYSITARK